MAFNLVNYLKQSRAELRKVAWPSWKATRTNTMVVIGISVFVAVFLGLMDLLFNFLMEKFLIR